jgi:hypothetical protein
MDMNVSVISSGQFLKVLARMRLLFRLNLSHHPHNLFKMGHLFMLVFWIFYRVFLKIFAIALFFLNTLRYLRLLRSREKVGGVKHLGLRETALVRRVNVLIA